MAKVKITFFCQNCGAQSPKWIGKCPHCNEWNTYVEEVVEKISSSQKISWKKNDERTSKPIPLKEIISDERTRIITADVELNRVLGGGIVPGSVILLAGNPGIGKSTLLLQLALSQGSNVLYISGEESAQQVKLRANRLSQAPADCLVLTETNVQKILVHASKETPQLIIVDSIQTLSTSYLDSLPGSISQIRESTGELLRFAKEMNIAICIIGHITKEGSIAGPKILEHMVDTVLQFEGERHHNYRIVRTLKNRFGSTDELGIYEMTNTGLRIIANPSELLLSQSDEQLSGSAVAATMEGMRAMLIETQALVSTAVYGTPQRSSTGFDLRRLSMLLAVLEKRSGFYFATQDVFLNLAGGIKISDPAIDLAIASALISSLEDMPIDQKTCFAGEIGLTGEVRAVNKIDQRIMEANRLGFHRIIISSFNLKGIEPSKYDLDIVGISKINELYDVLSK